MKQKCIYYWFWSVSRRYSSIHCIEYVHRNLKYLLCVCVWLNENKTQNKMKTKRSQNGKEDKQTRIFEICYCTHSSGGTHFLLSFVQLTSSLILFDYSSSNRIRTPRFEFFGFDNLVLAHKKTVCYCLFDFGSTPHCYVSIDTLDLWLTNNSLDGCSFILKPKTIAIQKVNKCIMKKREKERRRKKTKTATHHRRKRKY